MTDDNASGTTDTASGTPPLDNASDTAKPDNSPPPPAPKPNDDGISDEQLDNTNNAEQAMHYQ